MKLLIFSLFVAAALGAMVTNCPTGEVTIYGLITTQAALDAADATDVTHCYDGNKDDLAWASYQALACFEDDFKYCIPGCVESGKLVEHYTLDGDLSVTGDDLNYYEFKECVADCSGADYDGTTYCISASGSSYLKLGAALLLGLVCL
eukprot:388190_1